MEFHQENFLKVPRCWWWWWRWGKPWGFTDFDFVVLFGVSQFVFLSCVYPFFALEFSVVSMYLRVIAGCRVLAFFFLFLIGRKGFRIRCCCGFCCPAVIFVFGEIFVFWRIFLVNLVGCDGTVAGVSLAISFRGDNEHRWCFFFFFFFSFLACTSLPCRPSTLEAFFYRTAYEDVLFVLFLALIRASSSCARYSLVFNT